MSFERSAEEIGRRVWLTDAARQLLAEKPSARRYLSLLDENRLYRDAVKFAAHCLMVRQAIWWGALCLWEVYRPEPLPASEQAALQAAVAWVRSPEETMRLLAQQAAEAAGQDTPAGMLAQAVFFTGRSMTPPGQPPVAPPAGLANKTVASAALLAADRRARADAPRHQRQFVVLAGDVVEGRCRWEIAPATASPSTFSSSNG